MVERSLVCIVIEFEVGMCIGGCVVGKSSCPKVEVLFEVTVSCE